MFSNTCYDKRRSEFFTKELIIVLKLIDTKKLMLMNCMDHGQVLLEFSIYAINYFK